MRAKLIPMLLLLSSFSVARGADSLALSVAIEGRGGIETRAEGDPTYGMIETAVLAKEPIALTVTAIGVENDDWARGIFWHVTTEAGGEVRTAPKFTGTAAPPNAAVRAGRPNARYAAFELAGLDAGRYIVKASLPGGDGNVTSEPRSLAVYNGDESTRVREWALRERSRRALEKGTAEGYQTARRLLMEAARSSADPSIYEALGDASAPWADPDETSGFYGQSLDVARKNLEKRFGARERWPEKGRAQYDARERKVAAFRSLIPYYKTHFHEVRVVIATQGMKQQFAVERRRDGMRVRTVDIP